jgi:hypothetical protein
MATGTKRKSGLGPNVAGEDILARVFKDGPEPAVVASEEQAQAPAGAPSSHAAASTMPQSAAQPELKPARKAVPVQRPVTQSSAVSPEMQNAEAQPIAQTSAEPQAPARRVRKMPRRDGTALPPSAQSEWATKSVTIPSTLNKTLKIFVIEHPEHSESSVITAALAAFFDQQEGE